MIRCHCGLSYSFSRYPSRATCECGREIFGFGPQHGYAVDQATAAVAMDVARSRHPLLPGGIETVLVAEHYNALTMPYGKHALVLAESVAFRLRAIDDYADRQHMGLLVLDALPNKREEIWRQLIEDPQRSVADIILCAAEQDITLSVNYVQSIRARWRDSLKVIHEAGYPVPLLRGL